MQSKPTASKMFCSTFLGAYHLFRSRRNSRYVQDHSFVNRGHCLQLRYLWSNLNPFLSILLRKFIVTDSICGCIVKAEYVFFFLSTPYLSVSPLSSALSFCCGISCSSSAQSPPVFILLTLIPCNIIHYMLMHIHYYNSKSCNEILMETVQKCITLRLKICVVNS